MTVTAIRSAAALGALAIVGLGAAAHAQTAALYWDSNFQGRSQAVIGPVADLTASGFNDQASSVRLQGHWELCEHANYGGRCATLSGDVRNLSDWALNDRVTSLRPASGRPDRPQPGRPGRPGSGWDDGGRSSAVVYRDANFSGAEARYDGEQANLGGAPFNDQISSMRLRGQWEVCTDAHYRGSCQILEGDIRNLSSHGLNDRISSMRPTRHYGNGGGRGGDQGRRITVWRDADYAGPARELRGEQPNLAAVGLNDQISSMRLQGSWEACTDANFRGRCETFEGAVSNLSHRGMNDQISSLRPARGASGSQGVQ